MAIAFKPRPQFVRTLPVSFRAAPAKISGPALVENSLPSGWTHKKDGRPRGQYTLLNHIHGRDGAFTVVVYCVCPGSWKVAFTSHGTNRWSENAIVTVPVHDQRF